MKYLPLILANLRRSPLRSLLTAASIAFAIALVCLLRTMPEGLASILDYAASGTRVVVLNKAGFAYPLPYAYLQKVRALAGVTSAASWTWYGGVFEVEKGVTFPSFATEPEVTAEVFPDFGLGPEALAAFQSRRDGAILGRATAKSYGWQAGDRVALVGSVYPVDLEFQIVEVLPHDLSPVFLFHREYLDQALQAVGASLDTASLFYVRVDDRARIEPLRAEIDALFRNSPAQTLSETEREYFKNMFWTLRALGFSRAAIASSFLLEAALMAISGFALGSALAGLGALAVGASVGDVSAFASDGTALVSLRVGALDLAAAFVLAVAIGIGGALPPALRAARLRPIEALRKG